MSPRTLLAAAALAHFGLSLHVLSNGHPIEDSYILYIYSESLASGHGITYFKGGEHAEGATDFLWMMLLGAGSFLGVDVAVAAAALNTLGLVVLGYLAIALLRRRYEGKTLVAPVRRLEPVGDAPVRQFREALEREGWPSAVAKESFPPLAVVGGKTYAHRTGRLFSGDRSSTAGRSGGISDSRY